ncbi:AfsR/SARP family transcriptional regulator [Kocuria rosea]|jgi:DNA-binding SARP family transcriptional activator|uniref:AfsR/SARP family transcriptional regulator n=1 Tax=Kocuria rosea TaxID=1275 RepID=UPI0010A31051|nr:BTAD domain-containing putative transcriptional regulator [Kocuria rosea]THE17874.1 transcriptional regulator [Kocuria rosea]
MGERRPITLHLLGSWDLAVQGAPVHTGARQQRLLAALAVHGPRSRHYLAGLLWPECPEDHALGSLRAAVFTLSRRVPGALAGRGGDLALSGAVDVDLHRLLELVVRPVASWSAERDDAWVLDRPRVALLPGWYDDWVVEEQARLQELYVNAVEERAELCLVRGEVHHALALARTVRDAAPLRESAVRLLLRAHLALGNEAEARRAFQEYRSALAAELGEQPSDRVRGLLEPRRRR